MDCSVVIGKVANRGQIANRIYISGYGILYHIVNSLVKQVIQFQIDPVDNR